MVDSSDSYSTLVGMIFLFNLLLGTGVLTMPAVFADAGYVLGIIAIVFLCFISYIQTTFLIESMANANFVKKFHKSNANINETSTLLLSCEQDEDEFTDVDNEEICVSPNRNKERLQSSEPGSSLVPKLANVHYLGKQRPNGYNRESSQCTFVNLPIDDEQFFGTEDNAFFEKLTLLNKSFNIDDKYELGNMTELFLNRYLSKFFFFSIVVYLLGDLLIYNSMMSKSLRDIACTFNSTGLDDKCWDTVDISRTNAYRIFLLMFISILGPLTYAKIQKTKFIQILTIILRWAAFLSMFGITLKIFIKKENEGEPTVANVSKLPRLFGICIYSFMCHHSIPSIVSPIEKKKNIFRSISFDYILVMFFYILISMTGIFAFDHLEDVYTLNFQKRPGKDYNPGDIAFFDIFLPTFPIFTLFSSYTIVALSLINNMKVLINGSVYNENNKLVQYSLPLVAIIPPLIIALFTEDVSSIVQYVGSYSGTLIQYLFPCLLVIYSRRTVKKKFIIPFTSPRVSKSNIDQLYKKVNTFSSPFQSVFWLNLTFIWWIICISLVTFDNIRPLIFKDN